MNNQILLDETKELLLDEAAIVGGVDGISIEIIGVSTIEFRRSSSFLLG